MQQEISMERGDEVRLKEWRDFRLSLIAFICALPGMVILIVTHTICKNGFGCGTLFFFSPLSSVLSYWVYFIIWIPAAIALQRTFARAKGNKKSPLDVATIVLSFISLIPVALSVLIFFGLLLFALILPFSGWTF